MLTLIFVAIIAVLLFVLFAGYGNHTQQQTIITATMDRIKELENVIQVQRQVITKLQNEILVSKIKK